LWDLRIGNQSAKEFKGTFFFKKYFCHKEWYIVLIFYNNCNGSLPLYFIKVCNTAESVPYISYPPISLYVASSLCFYVHLDIPMIFCTEILLFKGSGGCPLSEPLMSISLHFHWSHTWTSKCPGKSCSSSFSYMYMSNYWGTIHKKSPQLHGSHMWTMNIPTQNSYILVFIHHIHSLSCSFTHSFWTAIRRNSTRWIVIVMLVICNNSNSFIYLFIYLLICWQIVDSSIQQQIKARAKPGQKTALWLI
jgi:hypothetical protein